MAHDTSPLKVPFITSAIITTCAVALVIIIFSEFPEKLVNLTIQYEHIHLDKIIGALIILLVARLVIYIRRQDHARGTVLRSSIETELLGVKSSLESIFNSSIPICVTSNDNVIMMANETYRETFETSQDQIGRIKCFDSRPGPSCKTDNCPLNRIALGAKEYTCESKKERLDGTIQHFVVSCRPFKNSNGKTIGIVESFQDITARKLAEQEKEHLIGELKKSLDKVKLLSGFIPICASCKKIRDDKGYWNQIESYIRNHSEAEFSHGICPDCAKKLYPDIDFQTMK